MKKALYMLMIGIILISLAACAPAEPAPTPNPNPNPDPTPQPDPPGNGNQMREFTLAELAQYDGLDGRPAYVAADGVVYDVSALPQWRTGTHGGVKAGQDVTQALNMSPHGTSVLGRAVVVGNLKNE